MSFRSRMMSILFGHAPQPPELSIHSPESVHLEHSISEAVERQKAATSEVIRSSLNQVTRADDVSIAVRSIVDRIEKYDDLGLRTADGALFLIERPQRR